jgi:hypothetical protein
MLAEWIDIVNLKNKFPSEKKMYEENHYRVFDMNARTGRTPSGRPRRAIRRHAADPHGTWLSSHPGPTFQQ